MILSELLGSPVVEGGHRVGWVADLRLLLDQAPDPDPAGRGEFPPARLYGVIVAPRRPGSFLGYERSGVSRPWPLAHLLGRRVRGSFLILWDDIAQLSGDGVILRRDAHRWSPALPMSLTRASHPRAH
jgi:hypothetical protein